MGHFTIVVDDMDVRSVGGCGEHSGVESGIAESPAVEEDEAVAVGVEEQVVKIVFGFLIKRGPQFLPSADPLSSNT